MADYNSLGLHPDREHLLALMGAAKDICAAFGRAKSSFEEMGYGVDASSIRHDRYSCKSEKMALKVCVSLGGGTDSLSVTVTLPQLGAVVFSAYWYEEEGRGNLDTYRPGAWEEYLLEQGALAKGILRRRKEHVQQKQEERRRAREETERRRFHPIDDSDIF